jgi:hypothetical protein
MPQCRFPIFCYFCVSEKLHRKYSQNRTKQKPNLLFFPKRHKVRRWDRGGGAGARITLGRCGPAPGRATRGWDQLVHPLTPLFRLYIPLDGKNLKDGSLFLETYCKLSPSLSRDREDPGAILGILPERRIPAGGILHHHGHLRSDVWVVYLGLRVHNSS